MKTAPHTRDIAKRISVFFCDSDGVMFPNTVLMGAPYKAKYRSYYDGQGLSLLRAVGIRVVFITNEKGESASAIRDTVEKLNDLPSSKRKDNPGGWENIVLYEGRGGTRKLDTAKEFLNENGYTLEDSAYMGDDLVDVPLLKAVALPAAPAQAEETIKNICLFVAQREGGAGAIRDFANMVLDARGINPLGLPPQ
ncbi:MAG: HAD hydrolase family protein [bacterium]|nr:HAD hydrolase family protein [bacterium]